MTLNVNSLLCRQCYACCDQTAEAKIGRFSLYNSVHRNNPHIKFDDEIKRDSLRISIIIIPIGLR